MSQKTKQWVVERTPYGRGFAVHVRRLDGWEVAHFKIYNGLPHDDRMENATLCAAAPDMLAVLEAIWDAPRGHLLRCSFPIGECPAECMAIGSVIRKARGGR